MPPSSAPQKLLSGHALLIRFTSLFALSLLTLSTSLPTTSGSAPLTPRDLIESVEKVALGRVRVRSPVLVREGEGEGVGLIDRESKMMKRTKRHDEGPTSMRRHKRSERVEGSIELRERASGKALGSFEWSQTKYLFGFGDSYSTTGWTPEDGGAFSKDISETTSNGPNWLQFLTGTYNASEIYMRNLARSGATIADELVKISDHEHPVKTQVALFEEYLKPQEGLEWTKENALVTMWVGVNDVGLSYDWENQTDWHRREFEVWYGLQEQLYDAGARNFLHLTAPPTFRVPLFLRLGFPTTEWVEEALKDYNKQLRENLLRFQEEHEDAVVMLFDAHKAVGKILDDAERHGFKNTTTSCWAYQRGTDSPTSLNAEACVNPVNEFFFIDDYHMNSPVHKILAKEVEKFLSHPKRVHES